MMLFGLAAEAKKSAPIEKESPPAETEIICFAAMEKWVCAPASDQQQAKAKAMRLIDEQKDNVIINTIPEQEQWQAVVKEEPLDEAVVESDKNSVIAQQSEMVERDDSVMALIADDTESSTQQTNEQTANTAATVNDDSSSGRSNSRTFSNWQNNHSNKWTLQAVGTTNLPNLEAFIGQHHLSNETMAVATTEVKGAPWHVVLVGLFESRDQALAFKQESESQGVTWAASSWPRPVDGIVTSD